MAVVEAFGVDADVCVNHLDADLVVADQNRIGFAFYLVSHSRVVWGGNHGR